MRATFRHALAVSTLTTLLSLTFVDAQQYVFPPACFPFANSANFIINSIGLTASLLCPADGPLSSAESALTSCFNASGDQSDATNIVSIATLIATADAFCSNLNAAIAVSLYARSACCQVSDSLVRSSLSCVGSTVNTTDCSALFAGPVTVSGTVYILQPPSNPTVFGGTTTTTIITTGFPTATATSTVSSTTVPIEANALKSHTRTIVGAAVGGGTGLILIVGGVGFVFYRRNKTKKTGVRIFQAGHDKAQLHADHTMPAAELASRVDHITVTDKELQGRPVHVIPVTQELPGQEDHAMPSRRELAGQGAHDIRTNSVRQELDARRSYAAGDDSITQAVSHHFTTSRPS